MHKERLFEQIAGYASLEEQSYVLPETKLYSVTATYIARLGLSTESAKDVVHEIEKNHGIVERHSVESFCFSHSSIQDYFVAKHALSRRAEFALVKERLEDESWSDVSEFICGLHPDPDEIFDYMIKRASLKDLKNYPAIERRAKLLYLMYRCISVGPVLSPEKAKSVNTHILESLQGFVRLMTESKVFPMCALGEGGVRHPYYHFGQKRPSLHAAMLPYRKLSNEILVRPVPGYETLALERGADLLSMDQFGLTETSVFLNTVVPLSRSNPDEVIDLLSRLKNKIGTKSFFTRLADETIVAIGRA